MIRKWPNIKGETLVETIIALSILSIGITISSMVILNSMRNLIVAKQRVIAVNIAREGIETMRSIRDTNWLLYSDRRRRCWNHDPSTPGVCDGNSPITPGTYIIYKHDPEGSWHLQLADVSTEIVNLSLIDIDSNTNSDGLDPEPIGDGDSDDLDMYNHMDTDVTDHFGTYVKDTPFSRYIVIEYMENQPDALSSADSPVDSINTVGEWNAVGGNGKVLNRMRVTSVVEWSSRGITHSVELKTIITDHLGREDLAS